MNFKKLFLLVSCIALLPTISSFAAGDEERVEPDEPETSPISTDHPKTPPDPVQLTPTGSAHEATDSPDEIMLRVFRTHQDINSPRTQSLSLESRPSLFQRLCCCCFSGTTS